MPESTGRVKACTECRQQKVRCDAFKQTPCSRCNAAGLPCVISKDFQRRPRQTKAQLQYELDRLKAQAEPSADPGSTDSPQESEASYLQARGSNDASRFQTSRFQQQSSFNPDINPPLQETPRRSSWEQQVQAQESAEQFSKTEGTLERTLNDVTLDPGRVNDCYASFLGNYAVYTHGLLEMVVSPNERYEQCPLLFWVIICVGSRGYAKDPTLYGRLGDPVLELMFRSLIRPQHALPVIQAAVILCTWPLPVDLVYREPSEALAGAAMSLAMQNGLHMYSREQDFVVRSLKNTTKPAYYDLSGVKTIRDEVVSFRTRIWAFCTIAFQDIYMCDGLPPLSIVPCFRRSESYGDIYQLLPERLGYRVRLHRIQVEATNLISGSCDVHGKDNDSTLSSMIISYDEIARSLPMPQDKNTYRFIRSCARLSIMGLFYVAQQEPNHIHGLQLYRICRETARLAIDLERESPDSSFYHPHFLTRMLMTATHIMLRMCKSPLSEKLDMKDAEATIFAVIDMFRKRALSKKDLITYHIVMLSELWTSKKAFIQNGVQNGLRVNMRYRLILNPVFDSFWWWRREYGRAIDEEHAKCAETSGFQDGSTTTAENNNEADYTAGAPPMAEANNLGMLSSAENGFWQSNMDEVFADFMNWWDFNALQTDMIQSDEFSPADGSLVQDAQMMQPFTGMPDTLMSGSASLV